MSEMKRERSGEPWESMEDSDLMIKFAEGDSINQLADDHRRTKAAICARLVHLGLIVEIPGQHLYICVGKTFATFQEIKE